MAILYRAVHSDEFGVPQREKENPNVLLIDKIQGRLYTCESAKTPDKWLASRFHGGILTSP